VERLLLGLDAKIHEEIAKVRDPDFAAPSPGQHGNMRKVVISLPTESVAKEGGVTFVVELSAHLLTNLSDSFVDFGFDLLHRATSSRHPFPFKALTIQLVLKDFANRVSSISLL